MTTTISIVKASDLMTADKADRMAELKREYCSLATSAKRMKEIYAEMIALRREVAGQ